MSVFDDTREAAEFNVRVPLEGVLKVFEVFDRFQLLVSRSMWLQILTVFGVLALLGGFLYAVRTVRLYKKHLLYGGIERSYYGQRKKPTNYRSHRD